MIRSPVPSPWMVRAHRNGLREEEIRQPPGEAGVVSPTPRPHEQGANPVIPPGHFPSKRSADLRGVEVDPSPIGEDRVKLRPPVGELDHP